MKAHRKGDYQLIISGLIVLALLLVGVSWFAGRHYALDRNRTAQSAASISNTQTPTTPPVKSPPAMAQHQAVAGLFGPRDYELTDELASRLKAIGFIGTAVIAKNGKIVANYSGGFADATTKRKNDLATTYNINSMQKVITGTLVMQEVAAGRLKLTDSLAKFYPKVPYSRSINLKQMLSMSSGLTMGSMGEGLYTSDAATIEADVVRLRFHPESYNLFNYQPINYVLLAGILERVTGKSYQELFETQIVKRLGLQQTAFGYELAPTDLAAIGYSGKAVAPYAVPVTVNPNQQHFELGTGQLYMSPGDYYAVTRGVLDGTLLSPASARQLFATVGTDIYSGGFYSHHKFKNANGAGNRVGSTISISEDGQSAIVIFTNYAGNYGSIKNIARELVNLVILDK